MKSYVHQILITDLATIDSSLPKATTTIKNFFDAKSYEHIIWDKNKIRTMIKDNFDVSVLKAYDKLKPYAYKADLARYCIAYVYGGWYVDINIEIVMTPPNISKFDMLLIRDYNNGTRVAPWQLANGLFYTVPKHPVFKLAIDMAVDNIKNNIYGRRSLSVTGPELFGRAVAQHGLQEDDTSYLVGDFVDNPKLKRKQFIVEGKALAIHKTALGGQVGVAGTNNYVEMWNNKDIYNEPGSVKLAAPLKDGLQFSIHTDNPVDGVEHFGYALAFHKIKDSINNIKLDGEKIKVTRNDPDTKIQLFMGSNPGQFHPNQYKIQMTQWESTLAPASWKKFAENYNEFWTANQFGANAIIRSGVPANKVFVYEHGIDGSIWTPKLRGQNDKVRFLHVDSDNPRKRSDLALWAFKKAFGDNPNYELTLKYSLKKNKYYDTFDNSKVDWNDPVIMEKHGRWDNNVRYIEEITSTEDLVKIYHYHDVLVYPSEGEGFGFIPLQALATGMPVISTGVWASYEKYFNGNTIDSNLGPSTFMNHYPGKCVIPIPRSTVELMKKVANNIDEQCKLFYNRAPEVIEEYSWENKTKPVIEALYKRVGKELFK
jgi:glycosyltransferase involved in cell wall biosynthesis